MFLGFMTSYSGPSTGANFWQMTLEEAFDRLGSGPSALSSAEAHFRRARSRPNAIEGTSRGGSSWLLFRQFKSPIMLILVVATVLAGLLGDVTDPLIIALSGLSRGERAKTFDQLLGGDWPRWFHVHQSIGTAECRDVRSLQGQTN